jgi:hypothetical protein
MLRVVNCVADCVWFGIPRPTEWQRIGSQVDAYYYDGYLALFFRRVLWCLDVTAFRRS